MLPTRIFGFASVLAALALWSNAACAQQPRGIPVAGYITVVPPHSGAPAAFDVNSMHVLLTPTTGYGIMHVNQTETNSPLQNAIQVGAYVEVTGNYTRKTKTTIAKGVYFRDDWDSKLSGIGVIDKVITVGPEPVYRADGYLIRIPKSADLTFVDTVNSLADVGVNNWLHFEGKRDASGVIVATKATFLPAKPTHYKGVFGGSEDPAHGLLPASERNPPKVAVQRDAEGDALPRPKPAIDQATGNRVDFEQTLDKNGNLTEDAGIRWGLMNTWHTIPASTPEDRTMQQRVRRIGERLIPAFQRNLPDDSPYKIHFRFYVVDEKNYRGVLCPLTGLILATKEDLSRLQNDDQLAALLANGVAYNLQHQAARIAASNRILLGAYAATVTVMPIIAVLPALDITFENDSKITTAMNEERARLILALLSDAGYDPWQAPEAWRLLYVKHLPKDTNTLPYPDFSGYQLSILNQQYSHAPHASRTAQAN